VFLLFDLATIDDARATWRLLKGREGLERNYWQQQDKGWHQAGFLGLLDLAAQHFPR
jgi:DNA polymerase-3 subunit chi